MINNKIHSFLASIFFLFFFSLTPQITQAATTDCMGMSTDGQIFCPAATEEWQAGNKIFYSFGAAKAYILSSCRAANDVCQEKTAIEAPMIGTHKCNNCPQHTYIDTSKNEYVVGYLYYSLVNNLEWYYTSAYAFNHHFRCTGNSVLVANSNNTEGVCKPQNATALNIAYTTCPTGTCPAENQEELPIEAKLQGSISGGDPVELISGNKFLTANDYIYHSSSPIGFSRTLNSKSYRWDHNWSYTFSYNDYTTYKLGTVTLPNGSIIAFQSTDGTNWTNTNNLSKSTLIFNGQYEFSLDNSLKVIFTQNSSSTQYNDPIWLATKVIVNKINEYALEYSDLNLTKISNRFGNYITIGRTNILTICTSNTIGSISNENGLIATYTYNADSSCSLQKVTYADNTFKSYTYSGSISSIKDELGNVIDGSYYNYTGTNGYGISMDGLDSNATINKVGISYSTGFNTITNGLAGTFKINTSLINGTNRATGYSSFCNWCDGIQGSNLQYNTNGYINKITDYLGNTTELTYDLNTNQIIQVKESTNNSTLTRQKDIIYDPTWNKVASIIEPSGVYSGGTYNNRITNYTYDQTTGQLIYLTVTAPTSEDNSSLITRTITYTYNGLNQLVEVSNPRNEKTSYSYNSNGQVDSVTNNLSQTTSMSNFDSFGNPQTINYPDNTSMSLTYNLRGNVISTTKNGLTTTLTRGLNQLVTQVNSPSGAYKKLYYDPTQRLNKIEEYNESNQLQGSLVYTLDNMSNPTKVQVLDSSGVEIRLSTKQYNTQNLLYKDLTSLNYANTYTYDLNGNVKTITDPNNGVITYNYDSLNRISSQVNPDNGTTTFNYNPDDSIASVVAPTNQTTTYKYNGFGEVIKFISPDTGTTIINRNDSGQVVSKTDARNITSSYTYDGLGRVSTIVYPNASENVTINYDSCNNGVGKICSINDGAGIINYSYDNNGYLESKNIVSGTMNKTLTYGYDNFGRVNSLTYPSGLMVTYSYTNDKVTSISYTSGVSSGNVVTNGIYDPFSNEVKSYNYGNGSSYSKVFNKDGLVSSITSSNLNNNYGYDSRLNINSINSASIGYDVNSRVTLFNGVSYVYNQNDNRTSSSGNNYNYITGSNKLNSMGSENYGYDLAGNQTNSANKVFSYNNAGKLSGYSDGVNNFSYVLNSLSERVAKINNNSNEVTNFMYEGSSLLGEYKNGFNQEYIYLNGIVVGMVKNGILYNVYNDHLGTPRLITDGSNNIVWKWDNVEAYGNNLPTIQNIEFNLRFSGQYFDNENGMHYNINRVYNPKTGKYISSDPLGLDAGSNTYGYVGGNPLSNLDPLGLFAKLIYVTESFGLNHWAININNKLYGVRGTNNILGGPFGDSEPTTISETNDEFYSNYSFDKNITIYAYDLKISLEQEKNLEKALLEGNNKYNLYTNNCGQYIFNALYKAGLYTTTQRMVGNILYNVNIKNIHHWTPTSFERELYTSDLRKFVGKVNKGSKIASTDKNGNNIIIP